MLSGIFTPMVTAFDTEGRLDLDANRRIIEHLIAGGVDGILLLGSIGEFFALTADEKRELIRLGVETVARRTALLVGTGGTVVPEVVELTRFARRAGADAAVIISPYYFSLDAESLYRYYAEIASATDLPIVLYNFPDRTATELTCEVVLRLARQFPSIRGIKDTVDSISHTRALIEAVKPQRPDFAVLSGYDEYLAPNLLSGGDGLIGGLSNIVPALHVAMCGALCRGDLRAVAADQKRLNRLMALYTVSQPFVGAIKAAVSLVVDGVCPACRPPAGALSPDQFAAVAGILRRAGVLD